jgi:hypothetical protein
LIQYQIHFYPESGYISFSASNWILSGEFKYITRLFSKTLSPLDSWRSLFPVIPSDVGSLAVMKTGSDEDSVDHDHYHDTDIIDCDEERMSSTRIKLSRWRRRKREKPETEIVQTNDARSRDKESCLQESIETEMLVTSKTTRATKSSKTWKEEW